MERIELYQEFVEYKKSKDVKDLDELNQDNFQAWQNSRELVAKLKPGEQVLFLPPLTKIDKDVFNDFAKSLELKAVYVGYAVIISRPNRIWGSLNSNSVAVMQISYKKNGGYENTVEEKE
jgi:hypothetical protein